MKLRSTLTAFIVAVLLTACSAASANKQTLSFGTSSIEISTDKGYVFDIDTGVVTNDVISAKVSFISGDTMSAYISTLISYAAKNYFVDAKKAADTHGNTRIYYICSHDGKTYYEGLMWLENSDVGVFLETSTADGMSAFEHIHFKVASSSNPITAQEKLSSLYAYIMGDVGTKTATEDTGKAVSQAIATGEEKSATAGTTSLVEPVDNRLIRQEDLENVAALYSLNLISDAPTDELARLVKYTSEDGITTMNYVVPKDEKTIKAMYKALIEGMGCKGDTNPIAETVDDGSVTYNFAIHDDTSIIVVRTENKSICDGIMTCFGYRYDAVTSDISDLSSENDSIILPTDTTTATINGTTATGYFLGDPIYQAGMIQTKLDDTDSEALKKALAILDEAIDKEEKFSKNCAGYFVMDSNSSAFNEIEPDTTYTFPAMIYMEDEKCYAQINITVANLSSKKQKCVNCMPKSYSLY